MSSFRLPQEPARCPHCGCARPPLQGSGQSLTLGPTRLCWEGRQAPALRAKVLQAAEHLVRAPRLRRVQLRVWHHDDPPAHTAVQERPGNQAVISTGHLATLPELLTEESSDRHQVPRRPTAHGSRQLGVIRRVGSSAPTHTQQGARKPASCACRAAATGLGKADKQGL